MEETPEHFKVQNKSIPLRPLIVAAVIFMTAIFIYMAFWQPGKGGPVIILGFLALMFLLFIAMAALFLSVISTVFKLHFSSLRVFYTAVIAAVGGIFLIGLQTLRQLQIVDIVLVVLFELILNFYLLRRF